MIQDLRIAPVLAVILRHGKSHGGTRRPVAGNRVVHQHQPAVCQPCHVDTAVIIGQGRPLCRTPSHSPVLGTASVNCALTASHQHMYGSPFILPEGRLNHTAARKHLSVKRHIGAAPPRPSPVLRAVRKAGPAVFLRGSRRQNRPVPQADTLVFHWASAAEIPGHQFPPFAPGQPAVCGFLHKGLPARDFLSHLIKQKQPLPIRKQNRVPARHPLRIRRLPGFLPFSPFPPGKPDCHVRRLLMFPAEPCRPQISVRQHADSGRVALTEFRLRFKYVLMILYLIFHQIFYLLAYRQSQPEPYPYFNIPCPGCNSTFQRIYENPPKNNF